MAVSNINLKTLEMNCTDLKERKKKLPRKMLTMKDRWLYAESVQEEGCC